VRLHGRQLLLAALISLTVAAPAAATFPGENGKISFNRFISDEPPTVDIFTVDPDGSNVFRVTPFGPGVVTEYSDFSPDGRTLAIQRNTADAPPQVWLIDSDGTDPRPLTAFPDGAFDPAFSPDGRTIALDGLLDGAEGIQLIPARNRHGEPNTGAKARRVTTNTTGGFDSESQFSPDGKWIVFTRFSVECTDDATYEDCETRIFRVRTDGRHLQQLTAVELNASAPDFHPTGRRIAFDTADNFVAPNAGHIMTMRVDGSGKRIVIRGDGDSFYNNPSFSPDGLRVAFAHWPVEPDGSFGDSDIWTARLDGGGRRQVTDDPAFENKPDWGARPGRRHHHDH
jgi:TolB protein